MPSQIEKYTKTLENQNLNDFLQKALASISFSRRKWLQTTKNSLAFQNHAVSGRNFAHVRYDSEGLSKYAKKTNLGIQKREDWNGQLLIVSLIAGIVFVSLCFFFCLSIEVFLLCVWRCVLEVGVFVWN